MNIEKKVKELVKKEGPSIKELSRMTGISARSFEYWNNGRGMMCRNVEKVLAALGYELKIEKRERREFK